MGVGEGSCVGLEACRMGILIMPGLGWEVRSRHSSWERRRRRNRGIMGVQTGTCRPRPGGPEVWWAKGGSLQGGLCSLEAPG